MNFSSLSSLQTKIASAFGAVVFASIFISASIAPAVEGPISMLA